MAQNYDFASSGWTAGAPATGGEQVFGLDAGGNLAAMPLGLLRSPGNANLDPARLPKARRARARVMCGTGRGLFAYFSDSTGAGFGAAAGMAGCRNLAPAAKMAKLMAAYGVPTASDNFLSDGGASTNGVSLNTYDPRVTLGTGWSVPNQANPAYWCLGGNVVQCFGQASPAPLTFAPSGVVDTFKVLYATANGNGAFTTSVDGGSQSAPISTSITSGTGIGVAVVSVGSPGAHTLAITPTSSAYVAILGVIGFNSQLPAIDVLNGSFCGQAPETLITATTGYGPVAELKLLAPDLTIIDLGINSMRFFSGSNPNYTPATFAPAMQQLITASQVSGDVLLCVNNPSNTTITSGQTGYFNTITPAMIAAYQVAVYSLAASNTNPGSLVQGLPVVDFAYLFGSGANAAALGEMYDQLHGNALLYQEKAAQLFSLLSKV